MSLNYKILIFINILFLTTPFGWGLLRISNKYVPELILMFNLVFILLDQKSRNFVYSSFQHKLARNWLLLNIVLALGAVFVVRFSDAYSDLRTCVMISFVYALLKSCNTKSDHLKIIFNISFICITSCLLFLFIFGKGNSPKFNIPSPFLITLIYSSYKMKSFRFIVLLLTTYISIKSGFRSNILVVLISHIFFGLLPLLKTFNIKSIIYSVIIVLSLISYFQFGFFEKTIEIISEDQTVYHQIVYKTEQTYDSITSGGSAVDSIRNMYLPHIFNNWVYFLLPSGLGHEHYIYNWGSLWGGGIIENGNSIDTGLGFLFLHYGILISIALLTIITYLVIKSRLIDSQLLLISFSIYFYFFGGHTFTQMGHAIGAGVLLFLIINMRRLNDINNNN